MAKKRVDGQLATMSARLRSLIDECLDGNASPELLEQIRLKYGKLCRHARIQSIADHALGDEHVSKLRRLRGDQSTMLSGGGHARSS